MKVEPMLAGWLTFAGLVLMLGPGVWQAAIAAAAGLAVGRQLAKERDRRAESFTPKR